MNFIFMILLSSIPYWTTYLGLYVFSNAWIALLSYHFFIMVFLVWRFKEIIRISLVIDSKKIFLSGVILTSFITPIIFFLWDYIRLTNLNLSFMLDKLNITGLFFILFFIYFFLVHPILEELFWRFFISYKNNTKYIFDIFFAGYHVLVLILFVKIPFVILSFIFLAISGMVWRYIKDRHNDYTTIFVTHALADFSILITIFILNYK